MRSFRAVGTWALAAAFCLQLGCGGGGDGGGDPISGNHNLTEFRIPAGTTRVATGNLKIVTTGPIEIAGTLRVDPGVGVSLYAGGDVTISGSILGTAPRASRGRGHEGGSLNIAGQNPTLTDSSVVKWLNPGSNINIVTNDETGVVTISAPVAAPDGSHSTERGVNGQGGGSIRIGDFAARILVGSEYEKPVSRPGRIRVSALLSGGRGGDGFDDKSGQGQGEVLILRATHGGLGGTIEMECKDSATLTGATLRAGRGGDGGDAGAVDSPTGTRARNGTAVGEQGQRITAEPGSGGRGGSVRLKIGSNDVTDAGERGSGGDAGNIKIGAGDGGPEGAGGETECIPGEIGSRGQVGTGGTDGKPGAILLVSGGNGGYSVTPGKNGGPGGLVAVVITQDPARYGTVVATLQSYGRGGNGFNGCSGQPDTFGTNGGAGSDLVLSDGLRIDRGTSLQGGNAGDGLPPGVRGKGGRNLRTGEQFPDGLPGVGCDLSGKVVTLNYNLVKEGNVVFFAGSRIKTNRFIGVHFQGPEAGCSSDHLHAAGAFTVDGIGPFLDQDKPGCGIGVLSPE